MLKLLAAGDYAKYEGALPSTTQISASVRFVLDANPITKNHPILALTNNATVSWLLYVSSTGIFAAYTTGAVLQMDEAMGATDTIGVPWVLGLTYDNTTLRLYLNGVQVKSGARGAGDATPNRIILGWIEDVGNMSALISYQHVKIWTGAAGILSASEMLAEAMSDAPIKLSGLYESWQDLDSTHLTGANGKVLTLVGTPGDATALPGIGVPVGEGGGGGITNIT